MVRCRIFQRVNQFFPDAQIRRLGKHIQLVADDFIQHLVVQQRGNFIDAVHIQRQNHRLFPNIGEQRDLAAFIRRQCTIGAA